MKRREFFQAADGVTAATAAAAETTAVQEGDDGTQAQPDFGGYLDDVDGDYEDLRSRSGVAIEVDASGNGGNLMFAPAGIWIGPGTTVAWEWTGEDDGHDVVANEGASLDSGTTVSGAGSIYEHIFKGGGITRYHCVPYETLDILNAVAAGDDMTTINTGGGDEKELYELSVPIQAHRVGPATILDILVIVIYTPFILKYGESPSTDNTGGGG